MATWDERRSILAFGHYSVLGLSYLNLVSGLLEGLLDGAVEVTAGVDDEEILDHLDGEEIAADLSEWGLGELLGKP